MKPSLQVFNIWIIDPLKTNSHEEKNLKPRQGVKKNSIRVSS
jgi:hypothetical protein